MKKRKEVEDDELEERKDDRVEESTACFIYVFLKYENGNERAVRRGNDGNVIQSSHTLCTLYTAEDKRLSGMRENAEMTYVQTLKCTLSGEQEAALHNYKRHYNEQALL